jgi:hypothetical protein
MDELKAVDLVGWSADQWGVVKVVRMADKMVEQSVARLAATMVGWWDHWSVVD